MIEDLPPIRTAAVHRPDAALVEQLRGTPTGFIVDAMGGSGALDFRLQPAIAEQYAFCGVALTCHPGALVRGRARNRGAVGFVTDGGVRALVGIRQVGLPAWAMGVTPNSPHRSGPGTVGFAVQVAGLRVCSGDVVVADRDGVVVVPQERLAQVLERLPAIRDAEAAADAAVRAGATRPSFLK